ncbi:MAG: Fpg/Nei family DNA glycosylase [Thermoanaerobaculia bacterium]
MPELPEVELYTRYFAAHALRQKIANVEVRDERILGAIRSDALQEKLRGRSFRRVARHGKHLFADSGAEWLHLHFGMSGDLAYYRSVKNEPRWARVVFHFTNGAHLAFEDMRLFGVVDLTSSPDDYVSEHRLGPDPLDPGFTLRRFRQIVDGRRGAIKSLLMSQDVIAGIGNLYADETLYQTGIHPRRPADELSGDNAKAIHTTMRRVLRDVIGRKARGATYPAKYLIPHREEGERCPKCGGTIRRTVVFGRTTYYCAKHQR